jgi:queuine tRNA-ribosyltransferase
MSAFTFTFSRPDPRSAARIGQLTTPHGSIDTPAFIAVGTHASVKSLQPQEVASLGAQAVLCNTYYLNLRPGPDLVADLGGLHEFMGWSGPLFTDSGTQQVFSLGFGHERGGANGVAIYPDEDTRERRRPQQGLANQARLGKIDDDGVRYRSYLDGSTHHLTPELAVEIQEKLGADVITALDQPTSTLHDEADTARALARTHLWAERSLAAKRRTDQALYGVVQGGAIKGLRETSAAFVGGLPFDGYVIGGSLGATRRVLEHVLDWTIPILPEDRPRHIAGISEPADLFRCVERGIDTFDSVSPIHQARRGILMTADGPMNIMKATYREDDGPIDAACGCPTCTTFSRAYLRHLFAAEEMLAATLATTHNLAFVLGLMAQIRSAIAGGTLPQLKTEVLARYARKTPILT